jgi:hypothetical protein
MEAGIWSQVTHKKVKGESRPKTSLWVIRPTEYDSVIVPGLPLINWTLGLVSDEGGHRLKVTQLSVLDCQI